MLQVHAAVIIILFFYLAYGQLFKKWFWLLKKLKLWASYCNRNPCGTYIFTDPYEYTFQLSFLETPIFRRAFLAILSVLVHWQVMQRKFGNVIYVEEIDPFAVR